MGIPFTEFLDLAPRDLRRLAAGVRRLHRWYHASGRDLPWRRTADPYAILVSEVMLQQTRVAAVIPYFERWMAAFPTPSALAEAEEGLVFKLWEGLGYYSRARNLQLSAREIVSRFQGEVPQTLEDVQSLPGVGPYTAAAVLSIAFGLDFPVLDGNVLRVLSRLTALGADPRRPPASVALRQLAEHLLPKGTAGVHNQALMELGAVLCTPRAPACTTCPLHDPCRGGASGRAEEYPVKPPRPPSPHQAVSVGIILDKGLVFINRRPYGKLLGGMWEFPGGKIEDGESAPQALARELREEFGMEVDIGRALPRVDHAYTHFKVTLHPYLCRLLSLRPEVGEGQPYCWIPLGELEHYAMPKANRKVIQSLKSLIPTPMASGAKS